MDAGWVKTFDEYYYGTRSSVSTASVQMIFHSVLSELLHDKRRKVAGAVECHIGRVLGGRDLRFIFSETAYFWRWWKEQRPNTRATFRSLVQEGRIEFAGGGWTHGDSATLGYLQTLDLWTWGLRKLNDTLGPCGKPKAAWQIDTYGHSREQVSLLAQMGFDGVFIGRVDHKEREAMMEEDRMEFMWRGSDALGKMSDIMTHTLFNLYNAPDGFCFDFLCSDEPLVDDPDAKVYNADKRVNDFIAQIERQAKYYDHDNILVTMGGDFTYQSAANWFMNIDKLINHVNTHPANISDVNIFYSSPSCYLKAIYLYGRRDKAIHTEKGDHLPYGSDATTYWTGFYSSRPSFKLLVRRAHVFLQIVKQLTVIARSSDSYELHLLRHAVGLVLHHDAVTGTSQQHVTNDFISTLSEAVDICTKKVSHLLSSLTPTWGSNRRAKNEPHFTICHQLNMSQCRFIETQETLLLLVYNPLSIKTYHYVRLPAIALHYAVRDFNDDEVEYQMVPLPAAAINLPGRTSNAIQEMCFEAENIPALGYAAYFISPIRAQLEEKEFAAKSKTLDKGDADVELTPFISNEYLKVTIDKTTGLLESIQHVDGVRISVSQNFLAYSQGQHGQQSGAYSFRPESSRPAPITDKVQYNTIKGPLVKEIRQRFSDWITQVIRLYRGEEFIELEWIVGPVPIGTDLGKEVVSVFSTNITNSGAFYTDSNGRQMMRRTCWNETADQKKPVAACYFPVTSRVCIKCENSSVEMCVLTDRPQGGTSYGEGEIELMVHRRLLTDDGFGLEETLNEQAYGIGLVVKGKHRIVFGNFRQEVDEMTFAERVSQAARRWELEPWLFFAPGDKVTRRKWQNIRNKRFSGLKLHGLPRHIHILTLEPWKAGSVLLRLENTLEKNHRGTSRSETEGLDDTKSHVTVELRKIFLQLRIKLVRETTLAANQWLNDARQMDWSTRYVYTGGDDGILAEDLVQAEDTSAPGPEDKDSGNYSDEDKQSRKRGTPTHKSRTKPKYAGYNRNKRSLSDSINIHEDVNINKAYKHEINMNESVPFNKTIKATTDMYIETTNRLRKMPKITNKIRFFNRPYQNTPNRDLNEEVRSSEEDFSSNLKKKNLRKKKGNSKNNKEEIIIHNSDDGITKSIYEMYYKTKPKQLNMKAFGSRRKNNRIHNKYEEPTESSRRKRRPQKRFRGDMPLYADRRFNKMMKDKMEIGETLRRSSRIKRRDSESSSEYGGEVGDDEDDTDEGSMEDDLNRSRNRQKRMALSAERMEPNNESEPDPPLPDYIVTLRPTQIRTFIVWFENSEKVYKQ